MDKIKNMRKLVAAFVGLVALAVSNFTGVVTETSILGMDLSMVTNAVISVLTMVGVYQVPNEPLPAEEAA